jgi:dipeptidyl-peptidase-4
MKLKGALPWLVLAICFIGIEAQTPNSTANYRLAERFSPKQIERMVFSTSVQPNWLESGDKFWYSYQTSEARFYYIVDLDKKAKTPLFDNHKMATQLTLITKDPYDKDNLPVINPKFKKGDRFFTFSVQSTQPEEEVKDSVKSTDKNDSTSVAVKKAPAKKGNKIFRLLYDTQTGVLIEDKDWTEEKKKPSWANVAPDSSVVIFARDYNLYYMDKENFEKAVKDENDSTIIEHQLTTAGEQYYAFGGGYTPAMNDSKKKIEEESKKRRGASILWSHDSGKFALVRNNSKDIQYLWVINSLSNPRPVLETYKYQMPGEVNPNEAELWVFDLKNETADTIDIKAFKEQTVSILAYRRSNKENLEEHKPSLWLSSNSNELYFTRISRDLKRYDLCKVDLSTKEVTTLVEERMNTYVDTQAPYLIRNTNELIHWSERDGWAHFYLYDSKGKLIRQITEGPWHGGSIVKVDEKARIMYFSAHGKENNENPYYEHLYRVNLDGSGLKLLNKGDYDHRAIMSDSFRFFVNNYSRVNTTPASDIRDNNGNLVMELETADLSNLFAAGYQFPETFKAKAADGRTDIYGVMYKPFDFDPEKKYPIIQYVYPGPQTEAVNTAFSARMDRTDRLAQIGFIVVTLGNRGGHPDRSKWYHNYGYGDLRDYGLADKKYVAEQLADRHSFIDIEQVGIFGHSGGGFMSTAALLQYPDFFKVAVSSAGNHDNRIYNRWWSEKHHGVKEIVNNEAEVKFVYEIETNPQLAKNLKGKLLLTTGDMDNNVHPANTLRVADALIKAKKRFDIFMLTGQRHGYGDQTEYNFWLTADYFAKYLIGDYAISTDIFEMRRETKMTESKMRKE